MTTPAEAHDAIAAAYDRRAAEYVAIAGTVEQLDPRDRDTIDRWRRATSGALLDAGCGPGLWTRFLHDAGHDVSGIDLSAEFVAEARTRHPGLDVTQGSFLALPQPAGSLGGVLAWYSLIHTPPTEVPAALAEFARVLAPGGRLLLGFFDGEPRAPFDHAITTAYFWSAEALTPLLAAAGLEVEETETRARVPGEASTRPHGALIARRV
ncbi:class I SAM-dependent methyltransferase [Microbacterium sufflavum]|uniref:Class I SAM-dependent methyltransferase n=1 Tax=Microbacterium sufflavum TaxID=2851649 RepID=A0ABY4IKR4_9MICO|nr:class I SAM-dependent methyltransferase [Microbacterium sufflavum]UPL12687.1 class I SAM-dependent methyltransferase [Microbacterium sufflavum]